MKYKLIGLIACVTIIILCIFAPITYMESENVRYHQHLEAAEKPACTNDADGVFCTHLPLVMIDTNGVEIPGNVLTDEEGNEYHSLSDDGEKTINCTVTVIDNESTNNHPDDKAGFETLSTIRIRGNSSRVYPKKNYALKFIDEDGLSKDEDLLGMGHHHEWALHGPYLDKTLIRNYMCYNIAGEIMEYSPEVRFCEVFLNGEYIGLYVATETITNGSETDRLHLTTTEKGQKISGYLLKLDRGSDTEFKNIRNFTSYARRVEEGQVFNIEYPGINNLTEEKKEEIVRDFSAFEKTLYSYDFDSKKYGYKEMIDVDSFAEYYLMNELTLNDDAGDLSTYIYKDIDGKFKLCVWDFNNSCNNYREYVNLDVFDMPEKVWFKMLMKDPDFVDRIITRYWELRETVFDPDYIDNYIDETIAYLGPAIERNYAVWGDSFMDDTLIQPAERNPHSYDEAVNQLKGFFRERIAWLDENIESLRQYSASSTTKKFNENGK